MRRELKLLLIEMNVLRVEVEDCSLSEGSALANQTCARKVPESGSGRTAACSCANVGTPRGREPRHAAPGAFFLLAVFAPDATRNGNTKLATGGLRDGKPPAAVRQECRRLPRG